MVGMGGKPLDSTLTIDAAIHDAVMALPPDELCDRANVNERCVMVFKLGPLRPAGTEDDTVFRRRRKPTHFHDAD
jgi:hypothetical protein